MTPEEKENIRRHLTEYITGTVIASVRLAHFGQTPENPDGAQYRIMWEQVTDGAMIAHVKELTAVDPIARYGVKITVETLPDLPPIGPENDPALIEEMKHPGRDAVLQRYLAGELDGSTFPCWECLTDPTEDPAPWCDCRPEDFGHPSTQHPGHPCRLRAHAPSDCLNRPTAPSKVENLPNGSTQVTYGQEVTGPSVWVATTMEHCLINDRIRLGAEEATVLRSNRGIWNVDTRDYWRPRADRHVELRLELSGPTAPPGFNPYPHDLDVEILCTPERLAVLRIQEGFPGSAPISSDVN